MPTTTWAPSLKQLAIALLIAATLAGCGGGTNRGFTPDNGSDDRGGNGDGGNGDGGNGDGGGGDAGSGGGGGDSGGDDKPTTATIGGTVAGLKSSIVLRINDSIQIELTNDGTFSVGTELATGSPYFVTIISQPSFPAQDCKVENGSGTIAGDVTNVVVNCSDLPVAALQAEPGPGHALLLWTTPSDATHFNVYVSSARDCDIANYSACPDGALLSDVSSPLKVRQLLDGKAYFFRVETVHTNGARGLSNEVAARPDQLTVQGYVTAVERLADGTVYLGGAFDAIGLPAGAAAPLDRRTGRIAQGNFPIVSDEQFIADVKAIASDGNGGWYIGGFFSHVGGVPRSNLAHVLADGSVDPDFDPSPDGAVNAIVVAGGRLYVGGYFARIAGVFRSHLAAFDVHDGKVLEWDLQLNDYVYVLAAHQDTLYVGGAFTSLGGTLYGGLAAIDASGAVQQDWRPIANGRVKALAVSNDTVYAAGEFGMVNSSPHDGIVALDRQTGKPSSSWMPTFNSDVAALAASGDILYVGGDFTLVNGQQRLSLAAIDANGQPTAWQPKVSSWVNALALVGDTIYVGSRVFGLVALRTDGTPLPSWNSNLVGGSVISFAAAGDTLYAGGDSRMLLGAGRSNLAAIDGDGALLPWHPQLDDTVAAIASDGQTLYVGGEFTRIGDANRPHLAAFDAEGTLTSWNPKTNKGVSALATANGIVYAGGDFDTFYTADGDAVPRRCMIAIDPKGRVRGWDAHFAADCTVDALATAEGVVFAGGFFESVGQEPVVGVRNFAAIDATTAVHLPGWEHRFNDRVRALRVHDDVVYIGGQFTSRDGLQHSPPFLDGISLLTEQPLPWDPRVDGPVFAFDSFEHLLYFGGDFEKAGGTIRSGLAALKTPNGTITLSEWTPPGKYNIRAIGAGPDRVYVGGWTPDVTGMSDVVVAILEAASSNGAPSLSQ